MLTNEDIARKFPLAFHMLQMWRFSYQTRWLSWCYNIIHNRLEYHNIPTPFDGE